jgi:hypothetical protein
MSPQLLHSRSLPLQFYFNTIITPDDYVRLGPNLSSWTRLNDLLILGQFTIMDLKKLLILELAFGCRKQVLTKLRSRITTAESKHIKLLITNALSPTATGPDVPRKENVRRSNRNRKPAQKR